MLNNSLSVSTKTKKLIKNLKTSIFLYKLNLANFDKFVLLQQILLLKRKINILFPKNINILINFKNQIIKKRKQITILKAPFVHKKAREQFSLTTFKLKIDLLFIFKNKLKNNFFIESFIFNQLKVLFKTYNIDFNFLSSNLNLATFFFEKVNKVDYIEVYNKSIFNYLFTPLTV